MKSKKRKWYQKKMIIYGIHICVFLAFIFTFESYTFLSNKKETKNLASFIQSFLWNLDDASANQYLEVYLQNQPIQSVEIFHPDQSLFLKIESKKENSILDTILRIILLIRNYNLESSIYYQSEYIGKIVITWKNENIYIYFYALIIFLLLSLVAFFYIETIKHKDELELTYQEIKELKTQQDADYYLTTLLIQPLLYKKTETEYYKVNKYIEQKKKFEYKNYKKEIGGDYILVKGVQLRNRNYIFFINADAMGKSLQGGSGILVLGSLLYAILKRLEFRMEDQSKFPETWLKYLCIEIQELFESFQGSMMLSAVIGLIDIQTGILYFINAEHPYPVIYRKGKAFFIGEEYILRKFGMPKIFQETIKIQIYELQEQDVLLVGSDGKDDIEMELEDGTTKINEDETLFLKNVEESEAELSLIINNITKKGKLIDDLSLLSLQCIKKEIPLIGNFLANDSSSIKKHIKNLFQNKKYNEIYQLLQPYTEIFPLDTTILYYFVIASYKLKKYKDAIEIGERILNRKDASKILKNLYPILVQLYTIVEIPNRARQLLEEFKNLAPNDPILQKLLTTVFKRKEQF